MEANKKEVILEEKEVKMADILDQEDEEMDRAFKQGVAEAIQETLAAGNPVIKYDSKEKKPYFLYPNGEKKYAY